VKCKISTTPEVEKYGTIESMEHISDAFKERNIILETSDPVVADGFTQVPNFILKNDALTVGEKITFAMFLTYAWNNDKVFPGQERLAKDIGVTRRSVNTFIKGLEKKGFLTIQRRGLGKTNIYTLKYRVQQNKSLAQKQRSRTS
jgi:biotin operon repressor